MVTKKKKKKTSINCETNTNDKIYEINRYKSNSLIAFH